MERTWHNVYYMGNIAAAITNHPSSSSPTIFPSLPTTILTDHHHPPYNHISPSTTLYTNHHYPHQPSLPIIKHHHHTITTTLVVIFFHILPLCLGNSINKNKAAFFSERTQSWRVIETQVCSVALIRSSCATLGSLLHFSDLNVPSVNEADNASSQIRTLYEKGLIGTRAY